MIHLTFKKDFDKEIDDKTFLGQPEFGGFHLDNVVSLIKDNVPLLAKFNYEVIRHKLFQQDIDERFILRIEDGDQHANELQEVVGQIKTNVEPILKKMGTFDTDVL